MGTKTLPLCRKFITYICCILLVLQAFDSQAQYCGASGPAICTPTAGLDSPGFYPSDTALPCVADGQAFNQVIDLVAPLTASGFTLDSIRIASLTNLPCGLCWASGTVTNTFAGGGTGCIRVTGTSNEAPGEYNVLVYATAWVHLFGSSVPLGPLNADSALGLYYYIRVTLPGDTCIKVDTAAGAGSQASAAGSIVTPSISGNTSICTGTSTTLTAMGANYYGYAWSNGTYSPSITVTQPGTYTVTVYDNCNSATASVNVTSAGGTATITASGPTTFCQGGSVTLTASAGDSYLWSSGQTTQAITATTAASYTVTVTTGGCQAVSKPLVVTVNPLPAATITAGGPTTFCTGGSVTLTASAGSSWLWSGGQTTQAITVTSTGSFTVQVTNANGCSATSAATQVTVNSNPTPTITAGGPTTFCQGGSVTLTASTGTAYMWSTGATSQAITVTSNGSYTVNVTVTGGCSGSSAPTVVTVNPLPTATITAGGPTTFCAGGSVTLTASAGSSWLWSDGETTQAITVTTTGSFTVRVTNANACSATSAATPVTANPLPAATITAGGPTTFCSGGSVTLTASAGSSWLWSDGETTQAITVNSTGSFTVRVTNANGCSATSATTQVTVNSNPTPTITASGPTTFCQGGSVTLTASTGTAYMWSTGATTQSISVSASGSITVNVTITGGCSGTSAPTVVTVNPLPAATITAGGPTTFCAGGGVTLTASAGSSWLWSNGETTQAITVTANGSFTVQVTNANGCSATSSATTVTVNPAPTATITAGGPTTFCAGGSVTLTASAGSSWSWSDGETTQAITVNSTGSYTVRVTNANGCSATSSATQITVNSNPTPTITAGGPTTFCQGASVTLTASSGTSYMWSTGATTQAITVTSDGSITVNVTFTGGCSGTSAPTVVTVNPLPAATISAGGPTTFCAGGSVTLTASAGSSWLWSDGETTQAISVTANGSFTVQVTNANACSATSSATTVTVNPAPTATITAGGPTTFCAGGSVTLTASAGSSWSWSDGETTQAITVNSTGSYTVKVTNSNGCSATSTATQVTVNSNPTPTITAGGPTTFCQGGSVILTASSGTNYMWSTGATTQSIAVTSNGSITVNVTFTGGCSGTSTPTVVTVNPLPTSTISAGGPTTFCAGGSVTLTASAGTSWLWSDGETTQSISATTQGNYTVRVTNANGCSATSAATTVTVNPAPTATITPGGPTTFCSGGSVTLTASDGSSWLWSDGETTQSITVTATGSFTVRVTNANGCSATSAATQVNVSSTTTITITPSGPTTFCQGGSVTLTATQGATYMWSDGETTQAITVTANGTFSVNVTVSGGCSGTSDQVTIIVNPLPTASISSSPATCGTDTLTANAASSYLWSTTETSQSIVANSSGTYSVVITDANGCSASASTDVSITPCCSTLSITCPPAVTVNADQGHCYASGVVLGTPETTSCGPVKIVSNAPVQFNVGTNVVIWTATDVANKSVSCEQMVTVIDNQPPAINCPGNFTVLTHKCQVNVKVGEPAATDNCAIESVTTDHPDNTYDVGTTTITWTATDSHGNTSNCSFTVKVIDTTTTMAVCHNHKAYLNETGNVYVTPLELGHLSHDKCAGIASEYLSTSHFDCSQIGRYLDTLTIVDISGDTFTCSAHVHVLDSLPPVAVCKSATVYLGGDGTATVTAADVDGGSYDNCGIVSGTVTPNTFSCRNVGLNYVQLTVTDASGNASSCYARVDVRSNLSCSITAVPNGSAITGSESTTIYLGYGPQSVTLQSNVTGGTPGGYLWIGDGPLSCYTCANPVFTPRYPGFYFFSVFAGEKGGCFTECNITICVIDIRVNGAGSNNVFFCHNGQTITASVSGTGPGSVAYYLQNFPDDHLGGCRQICAAGKDADLAPISADVPGENQFEVSVYPNPYSSEFHLKLQSSSQDNVNLKVYDVAGKLLEERREVSYGTDIILGNGYATGVYLIQVNQGETTRVLRVVKSE